ncbi:hypothetical protein EDB80DRAFT_875313 [Ilyonectria destructans]|nr:hypothetical protein EDB80DRAFT_875313 [Ilyonectria destructans]
MAHIYLLIGKYETSKGLFSAAVEYISITQDGESNDVEFLRLLRGLATSCKKTADLAKAEEALQSALAIAESVCGHMSDEAIEIDSQLEAIRERVAVELDHRKRALVASTGGKLNESYGHGSCIGYFGLYYVERTSVGGTSEELHDVADARFRTRTKRTV